MIVAFEPGILGWVLCDHSETFQPLLELVVSWQSYFYVTDEWLVDPIFNIETKQFYSG
ncbi:hypothetical protein [Chamaesiphon sp.]|uniref:hypothetical protein n=1 Tax=Chamaesiphon sp. TaxID=2814140 RepID=UPI00359471C0